MTAVIEGNHKQCSSADCASKIEFWLRNRCNLYVAFRCKKKEEWQPNMNPIGYVKRTNVNFLNKEEEWVKRLSLVVWSLSEISSWQIGLVIPCALGFPVPSFFRISKCWAFAHHSLGCHFCPTHLKGPGGWDLEHKSRQAAANGFGFHLDRVVIAVLIACLHLESKDWTLNLFTSNIKIPRQLKPAFHMVTISRNGHFDTRFKPCAA